MHQLFILMIALNVGGFYFAIACILDSFFDRKHYNYFLSSNLYHKTKMNKFGCFIVFLLKLITFPSSIKYIKLSREKYEQ